MTISVSLEVKWLAQVPTAGNLEISRRDNGRSSRQWEQPGLMHAKLLQPGIWWQVCVCVLGEWGMWTSLLIPPVSKIWHIPGLPSCTLALGLSWQVPISLSWRETGWSSSHMCSWQLTQKVMSFFGSSQWLLDFFRMRAPLLQSWP